MSKTKIYDYLAANRYLALATASSDGQPEVATVEYLLDGEDLVFNTNSVYRKYQNLITNPRVAAVVSTDHEYTLQFEGTVHELEGDEATQARADLLKKEPDFKNYFDENTRFFRLTPSWLRLRDYTQSDVRDYEVILK